MQISFVYILSLFISLFTQTSNNHVGSERGYRSVFFFLLQLCGGSIYCVAYLGLDSDVVVQSDVQKSGGKHAKSS